MSTIDERWEADPDKPNTIRVCKCPIESDLSKRYPVTAMGQGEDMQANHDSIIADHNACLGIEKPETTVRELVAALRDSLLSERMLEALDAAGLGGITARLLRQEERVEALLAKCKEPE